MTADIPTRTPIVARTRAELTEARAAALGEAALRENGGEVAVVMTMGALHDGHGDLLRRARERAAVVIATIFVNPLQFGPNEDFDRYPRTFDADLRRCADLGADIVFAPGVAEVYPAGEPMVKVTPGPMGEVLEGESRPGFFTGVLTVVNKLLHLTAPDVAYFGEKDAQQLALVRRMVADLNMPVEIVGVPTVREPDGLALSSRNRYLSVNERESALALSRALRAGGARAAEGAAAVREAATAVLDAAGHADPPLILDYVTLVEPDRFTEIPDQSSGPAILMVAARVGSTRLIDNLPLRLTLSPSE